MCINCIFFWSYWIWPVLNFRCFFLLKIRFSFKLNFVPSTECASERGYQQSNREEEERAARDKLRTTHMLQINSYSWTNMFFYYSPICMIELDKTSRSVYLFSFRTFTYLLAKHPYQHWVREVIVQDTKIDFDASIYMVIFLLFARRMGNINIFYPNFNVINKISI